MTTKVLQADVSRWSTKLVNCRSSLSFQCSMDEAINAAPPPMSDGSSIGYLSRRAELVRGPSDMGSDCVCHLRLSTNSAS